MPYIFDNYEDYDERIQILQDLYDENLKKIVEQEQELGDIMNMKGYVYFEELEDEIEENEKLKKENEELKKQNEELKKQNEKLKMVAKANQSLAERVRQLEQEKVLKEEQ